MNCRQQDRDKLKQLAPPPQMDLFGRRMKVAR
jgi:hypothetical protein